MLDRRRMMQICAGSKLPSGYRSISFIEATGTQYIQTGLLPVSGTGMDAEYEITDGYAQTRYYIAGCYHSAAARFQFSPSSPAFCGYGDQYSSTVSLEKLTGKHQATVRNGSFYVDDSLIWQTTSTSFSSAVQIYVFAVNADGSSVGSMAKCIRLYHLKLLQGEDVMRDFWPALRIADKKPGLYDTVTKQFFTNAGTGEFTWQ